ncbi:hypothetical protein [Sphingomonas sp. R86521]|uniref:hypothetical protein n=1 Tax=Sphingomonas sp. R86521 TaxID=3093860 RepID=UPI0036D2E153
MPIGLSNASLSSIALPLLVDGRLTLFQNQYTLFRFAYEQAGPLSVIFAKVTPSI